MVFLLGAVIVASLVKPVEGLLKKAADSRKVSVSSKEALGDKHYVEPKYLMTNEEMQVIAGCKTCAPIMTRAADEAEAIRPLLVAMNVFPVCKACGQMHTTN